MVHDLRVEPGPEARRAAGRLWDGVEDFARFYGFASVLAVVGAREGLVRPDFAPGRGWMTLDEGPDGTRMTGKVLTGPVALPRFPRDWKARASALGPGPVIQSTGESQKIETRAARLCARAAADGLQVRRDRLTTPEQARGRAVSPDTSFSVVMDGVRLGGAEMSDAAILAAFGGHRPS
jgi:hypothetical protein